MPAVAQLPGETRCYRCDKLGDLRRCSRCQIARYCSPECQRADWKDHKPRCQDVQDDMQDDEPMEKELKVFRKWTAAWTDPLLSWALFAANLANQPSDYLLTNSFYIIIERQPQAPKGVLAKYRVYWGGMSPDTVILDHLKKIPDAGYREQTMENFQDPPPTRDTLRITVALPERWMYSSTRRFITQIFQEQPELGPPNAFMDPLSADSQLLSTALRAAWVKEFAQYIQNGNTSGHIKVLRDLREGAATMTAVD